MNGEPVWDGVRGTAGGERFGGALRALAAERDVEHEALARACGIGRDELDMVLDGRKRVGISALARLAAALRTRPIEFMQRTQMLSLEVYAGGLDPLFFLPDGEIRYDARIYMREINPRHQVPEADMTRRNPALRALAEDSVLDAQGKIELEFAYLLRTAVQETGGEL